MTARDLDDRGTRTLRHETLCRRRDHFVVGARRASTSAANESRNLALINVFTVEPANQLQLFRLQALAIAFRRRNCSSGLFSAQ